MIAIQIGLEHHAKLYKHNEEKRNQRKTRHTESGVDMQTKTDFMQRTIVACMLLDPINIFKEKLTFSSAIRYILPTSSAAAEQTSDRKPVTDLGEKKPLPNPGSLVSCNVTHPCIGNNACLSTLSIRKETQ
jgi:hypothetical protein